MRSWMHVWTVLLSCLAPPAAVAAPKDNPLVGTWVLDRFVDVPDGGEPVYPYGKKPIGQFIFSADGHFAFNVMRNPPIETKTAKEFDPKEDSIPGWYVSYFGSYRYDPAGPSWTATVTGGNIPGYIGSEQTRSFKLDGNVMTISGVGVSNGKTIRVERVLHKVAAN